MATEAVLTASQMASRTSKLVRREEVAEGRWPFISRSRPDLSSKQGSSLMCDLAHELTAKGIQKFVANNESTLRRLAELLA